VSLVVFVAIVIEHRATFFCRILPLLNQLLGRNIRKEVQSTSFSLPDCGCDKLAA
jgi:hypothetical protein